MATKSKNKDKSEAETREDEVLRRMLNTPPKPRKTKPQKLKKKASDD